MQKLSQLCSFALCSILTAAPAPLAAAPDGTTATRTQAAKNLTTSKEFFARGMQASDSKDYAGAVRAYTEAIRLNPHYGEAYGNRGAAKFNLKDNTGALSDYNAALRVFPNNQALIGLKAQVKQVLSQNANAQPANNAQAANLARTQALLGGDLADPSTIIMMNAQRRGLVPNAGDPSDPATIIMNNAKRRGLIPANTPNP